MPSYFLFSYLMQRGQKGQGRIRVDSEYAYEVTQLCDEKGRGGHCLSTGGTIDMNHV